MSFLPLLFLQGQAPSKPVHPTHRVSAVADPSPVTAREVRAIFAKVGSLLLKVNGVSLGSPSIPDADRPATRAEIVGEMARLYKAAEPTFRFVPMPVAYDPRAFRIDVSEKAALGQLVLRGCVARVGPLAVGPGTGLTVSQFGDAVGFFTARLAQMSHLPSPKWTPMLQGE